jgi:signal transduction histidine kinase
VRQPDFLRTTTFRWTLGVAGAFVLCIVVLFGFVYWQTAAYMNSRIDGVLAQELDVFTALTPEQRLVQIEDNLGQDPRRIRMVGLFGADGHRAAGNMERLPPGLAPDVPANAVVVRVDGRGRETQDVRLAAHPLPDGEVLVIGRNIDEIHEIAEIVGQALALGLLPGFALAVGIGMVLSLRALDRLSEVNRRIQRIVAGDLRERLPARGSNDPFDQLAVSVNRMLGEIEALIHEIAGVGDDIAHDLRTPLTRVRVRLERGREHAGTLAELRAVADQAITGLDQALAIVTALLRIAEIEHSRRLEGFGEVWLAPLLREVGDLYEPIAEDKRVTLRVEAADEATVHGDRDLLFEAVANLVDNAVKFTPEGGRVELALLRREGTTLIRVSDTGPGISEMERGAVTKRFYRSDKSRRTEGLGLGLSLVAAIINLHGFHFTIAGSPGCTAEIACGLHVLKAEASCLSPAR